MMFDQVAAVVPRICDKGRVVLLNALKDKFVPEFFSTEFVGIFIGENILSILRPRSK